MNISTNFWHMIIQLLWILEPVENMGVHNVADRQKDGLRDGQFNSLPLRRGGCNFNNTIFKLISWLYVCNTSCEIVLRWMSQNIFDGKSTLTQLMAWCHQAPSHYLSRCWPRSMSPYGITRPQCVEKKNKQNLNIKKSSYQYEKFQHK